MSIDEGVDSIEAIRNKGQKDVTAQTLLPKNIIKLYHEESL